MRLHVVALPHTRFTPAFSWCAYTTKVARFAQMMADIGIDTITYGNGPDFPNAGKYVMVTEEEFPELHIPEFAPFDPAFQKFNMPATAAVLEHIEDGDVVCLIGGTAQQDIGQALRQWPVVEFGVGYLGVFAQYKVFESYAWQQFVYGHLQCDGSEDDTVIYNYFDPEEFRISEHRDYFAYLGRVIPGKGIDYAITVAQRLGIPLRLAGPLSPQTEYVKDMTGLIEYEGVLDNAERAEFLSHALRVFTPTRYVEPFCGVHVEAMLSGVPVITPDFGIFPETVTNGYHGYRCRTLEDYMSAVTLPIHHSPE